MFGSECHAGQKPVPLTRIDKARQSNLERLLGHQGPRSLGIGDTRALFDGDVAEHQSVERLDALASAIPLYARHLPNMIWKQIKQPFRLDGARQPHERRFLVAAVFGFHRHQKFARGHGARCRQLRRAAASQLQVRSLTPTGYAVRKGGQHGEQQRILITPGLLRRFRDTPQLAHQLRRARVPLGIKQDQQVGACGRAGSHGQACPGAQ